MNIFIMLKLTYRLGFGGRKLKEERITVNDPIVTIGRHLDSHIRLDLSATGASKAGITGEIERELRQVSRLHGVILKQGGKFTYSHVGLNPGIFIPLASKGSRVESFKANSNMSFNFDPKLGFGLRPVNAKFWLEVFNVREALISEITDDNAAFKLLHERITPQVRQWAERAKQRPSDWAEKAVSQLGLEDSSDRKKMKAAVVNAIARFHPDKMKRKGSVSVGRQGDIVTVLTALRDALK